MIFFGVYTPFCLQSLFFNPEKYPETSDLMPEQKSCWRGAENNVFKSTSKSTHGSLSTWLVERSTFTQQMNGLNSCNVLSCSKMRVSNSHCTFIQFPHSSLIDHIRECQAGLHSRHLAGATLRVTEVIGLPINNPWRSF